MMEWMENSTVSEETRERRSKLRSGNKEKRFAEAMESGIMNAKYNERY